MSAPVALPSLSLLLAASSGAAASPVILVLEGSAQLLAALAAAAQVAGTIAPSADPGEATLLTALGALSIKTPTDLPAGTRLVLQAIAGRPGAALVIAINDVPTAQRATPTPAPTPMPTPGPLPTPMPPTVLELGTTVTAIVVGTAEPPLPELPSGTPLEAAARAPIAPSGQAIVRSGGPTIEPSQLARPEPAAAALAPPGERARAVPPGTAVSLRVLAVQPVPLPGSPPIPALSGVVIPSPQQSTGTPASTLVDTPAGVLRLFAATEAPFATATGEGAALPLPLGTQVTLRLLAESPAAALATVPATDAPLSPPAATATDAQDSDAVPQQDRPDAGAPAPAGTAKPVPAQAVVFRVLLADPGARQSAAAPQPIIGTVLAGHAASGASPTLIATPFGTLAVAEPLALPPGTLLLFIAQDDPLAADAPTTGRPTRLETGWSTLGAALQTLEQAAPQLAAHFRADLSAQSGERLAASFLFLVAALRGDVARSWPGDAIEHALALAGRGDLKLRIDEAFAETRAIANNPATAPWQVFVLPLVDGAAVRPIRLYLKRRGERGRHPAGDDHARFILEFELTRLGTMQLDGFVRPRRFDLVLRSHAPLTAPLRGAVERIFYERVAAAGLAGSLDFATAARFDVTPLDGLREKIGLAV